VNNCESCKFSEKSRTELSKMFCKRFPPYIVGGVVPVIGGASVIVQSAYPTVDPADKCGEFEKFIAAVLS
jgi:hypothetical protein